MTVCKGCGTEIPAHRNKGALFCSRDCSGRASANQWRVMNPGLSLSCATMGALSELRVSADLLCKGYEVFRALSASCSCDLAILKDGKLLTVEVRTAYRKVDGSISKSPLNKSMKADIGALVCADGKIEYMGLVV